MLLTQLIRTLRNSGLIIPDDVQSNFKSLFNISFGRLYSPTKAPIIPPTIQAFVSVSPPKRIVSLIVL